MDRRRGPEHSVPHGMGREDCACSKHHRVRFIGIFKGIFSKGKQRHAVGPDGGSGKERMCRMVWGVA